MSLEWASKVVTNADRATQVTRRMTVPAGETLWAIVDGATSRKLRTRLSEEQPVHACLLGNDLKPDLAEVAPYLIEMKPPNGIAGWVFGEGWGHHWGIFLAAKGPLAPLVAHFKTLLVVKLPTGKTAHFRFFDPRILQIFLPTCDQAQVDALFGPVSQFFFEGRGGKDVVVCRKGRAPLTLQSIPV